METRFPHRVGLVIWLYTPKYVNKLKKYGLLHYVSKKMNYAILYVNEEDKNKTEKELLKQHFVRDVELSQNNELTYTYDGVLEEVEKMTKKENEEQKEDISLFTQLSDRGGI